jgi:hypothetical protein
MIELRLALLSALALAAGCTGGEASPRADAAPPAEEEASLTEEMGRDLATIDVCALVPAVAVAEAAGGTVLAEPTDWDPGLRGKGCRYKTNTKGFIFYTEIGLVPPDDFDFLRETAQVPTHDVRGLADGAWWMDRTDRTELFVLKRGGVMIWVRSQVRDTENAEPELRPIAEVVLDRL